MSNIMQLARNELGVTAIEYALIASLIALVIIGGVTLVGTSLSAVFDSVATAF
jgi:pilus assembly protein Flp/PilA